MESYPDELGKHFIYILFLGAKNIFKLLLLGA